MYCNHIFLQQLFSQDEEKRIVALAALNTLLE
jgi:hypothetical protein